MTAKGYQAVNGRIRHPTVRRNDMQALGVQLQS